MLRNRVGEGVQRPREWGPQREGDRDQLSKILCLELWARRWGRGYPKEENLGFRGC